MAKARFTFRQATEGELPPFIEKPSHQATLESQVWVPFWWALITAGAVLAGAWLATPDIKVPFRGTLGIFLFVFLAAWLWLSGRLRKLLQHLEPFFGKDLDGDGSVGPKTTIRVELRQNGQIKKYFDADSYEFDSDNAFIAFAKTVVNSGNLTEAVMGTDKKAFPRGMNSWRRTRGLLEKHNYIEPAGNTWAPTDALLDVCVAVLENQGYVDEQPD